MDEQENYEAPRKAFAVILGGGLIGLGAVMIATAFARKQPCGCEDEEVNDEAPHLSHPDEDTEPIGEPAKWPDPVTEAEQVVAAEAGE